MPEGVAKADKTAYVNWDGFSELPKEGLDYLLDTTALNKKLADKRDSPYRWRTASFQVPKVLSGETLKKTCKTKVDAWLNAFEKQGWTLASKVQIYPGQNTAFDVRDGIPILDMREILVRGIFKTNPKPIRIELPSTSVKHYSEEKGELGKVMKGEGLYAVPRSKRPTR